MRTKSKFRKFRSTEAAVFLTQQISRHILFLLQQKWAHRQDPQALQKNKLQFPFRDLNLYSASDNGQGEPSSQMACPAGRSLLVVARAESRGEGRRVAPATQRRWSSGNSIPHTQRLTRDGTRLPVAAARRAHVVLGVPLPHVCQVPSVPASLRNQVIGPLH